MPHLPWEALTAEQGVGYWNESSSLRLSFDVLLMSVGELGSEIEGLKDWYK